jgi:hypothetical protein
MELSENRSFCNSIIIKFECQPNRIILISERGDNGCDVQGIIKNLSDIKGTVSRDGGWGEELEY